MTTGDRIAQQISFDTVPGATVGVPVVLTASSSTHVFEGPDSPTGLVVSYSSRNQQVCTVSGATLVPWTAGLCVITASQDGNARYLPAESVTQRFTVARASQTIAFTPPASATIDQSVNLTATASSWLPVTYTSSCPERVHGLGSHRHRYRGRHLHHRRFPARRRPIRAGRLRHRVLSRSRRSRRRSSFSPPASATVNEPVTLTATASSGCRELPFRAPRTCARSPAPASPPARGATCTITASQPGDGRYAPADPVTGSIAVQKNPQTISFIPPARATVDEAVTLTATASSELTVFVPFRHPRRVQGLRHQRHRQPGGNLHHHRLPARRRQVRASRPRDRVHRGPEEPADDQLHTAGARHSRRGGHPDRHRILGADLCCSVPTPPTCARSPAPASPPARGEPAPSPPPSPATAGTRQPTP